MKYTGGNPEKFNVWVPGGEPQLTKAVEDKVVRMNTDTFYKMAFIVLDEAQNTSPEPMKMFPTRLGLNSKMVITGDVTQVDLGEGRRSGLLHVGKVLGNVDGIGFVELDGKDVVRHRIVAAIVEAYRRFEEERP